MVEKEKEKESLKQVALTKEKTIIFGFLALTIPSLVFHLDRLLASKIKK